VLAADVSNRSDPRHQARGQFLCATERQWPRIPLKCPLCRLPSHLRQVPDSLTSATLPARGNRSRLPQQPNPPDRSLSGRPSRMNPSNSRALGRCDSSRVAIMNNGAPRPQPRGVETVHDSPGMGRPLHVHTAEGSDAAHNSPESLIATPGKRCRWRIFSRSSSRRTQLAVTNRAPAKPKSTRTSRFRRSIPRREDCAPEGL